VSRDLTSDDYAEMAGSYEANPPRRDEMTGEPYVAPSAAINAEPPDAVTGEEFDTSAVPGEPPGV